MIRCTARKRHQINEHAVYCPRKSKVLQMLTNLIQMKPFGVLFFFAMHGVRKLTRREQAGNPASFGIRYSLPYAAGQCSAEPWVMNINRGITNITITTKRRGVFYKRTQSDETNENCIPATYGIPISRCCGSVPIKTLASKTAPKVTRTLRGQELMSSAGGMTLAAVTGSRLSVCT